MGDEIGGVQGKPLRDQAKDLLDAMYNTYPAIADTISNQTRGIAHDTFGAQRMLLPKYATLANQLEDIAASGEMNRIRQYGPELIQGSGKLARAEDPQYYAGRELMFNKLADIINRPMTGGELEAINRGLSRQQLGMGLGSRPTAQSTIAAATTFGDAARNRQLQGLGALGTALPTFQTVSPALMFQQMQSLGGLGKNTGTTFGNISGSVNNQANMALGGQALNEFNKASMMRQQLQAARGGIHDRVLEGSEAFSNIAGGFGGMGR